MDPGAPAPFPPARHDHARCVADALAAAEAVCAGASLTPLRRRVLELVWSGHRPVGAYDLLARLRDERPGAAPPTVYRALDFLLERGLVHRIESLNAFVGCAHPGGPHRGQFLICRGCGRAAELADAEIAETVAAKARAHAFAAEAQTVEVRGLCPDCDARAQGAAPHG